MRRLQLRLAAWIGRDGNRDDEHRKQADQQEEWDRREQQPRRFRLRSQFFRMCPPKAALSRHRDHVSFGPRPGLVLSGTRQSLLVLHGPLGALTDRALQCRHTRIGGAFAQPVQVRAGQPFGGTLNWASVRAPQVRVTVWIAALLGIVVLTSHQFSGAA